MILLKGTICFTKLKNRLPICILYKAVIWIFVYTYQSCDVAIAIVSNYLCIFSWIKYVPSSKWLLCHLLYLIGPSSKVIFNYSWLCLTISNGVAINFHEILPITFMKSKRICDENKRIHLLALIHNDNKKKTRRVFSFIGFDCICVFYVIVKHFHIK